MGLLDNKVIIVSGVGPGLGAKVARRAAAEGAAVVLGARREATLEELSAELRDGGSAVAWATCDVTNDDDCRLLAEVAVKEFGGIDGVVNNAFYSQPRDIPIEESDFAEWQQAFDVNLFGSLRMSRAAVPAMRARGEGSIVFVNSQIVRRVFPGRGPYATSKGALLIAAKILAKELGPDNIRVNTVLPGRMASPALIEYFARQAEREGISTEEKLRVVRSQMTLPEVPTDEECAGSVLFCVSDLSRGMTGATMDVNGGETFPA